MHEVCFQACSKIKLFGTLPKFIMLSFVFSSQNLLTLHN